MNIIKLQKLQRSILADINASYKYKLTSVQFILDLQKEADISAKILGDLVKKGYTPVMVRFIRLDLVLFEIKIHHTNINNLV